MKDFTTNPPTSLRQVKEGTNLPKCHITVRSLNKMFVHSHKALKKLGDIPLENRSLKRVSNDHSWMSFIAVHHSSIYTVTLECHSPHQSTRAVTSGCSSEPSQPLHRALKGYSGWLGSEECCIWTTINSCSYAAFFLFFFFFIYIYITIRTNIP